MMNAEDGT